MTQRVITFTVPIASLKIDTSHWPEIAGAKTFDADHTSYVRVMRHRSGQSIVYGMHSIGGKDKKSGAEFVDAGGDVAAAVQSVSRHCGCDDSIPHEVIGKL